MIKRYEPIYKESIKEEEFFFSSAILNVSTFCESVIYPEKYLTTLMNILDKAHEELKDKTYKHTERLLYELSEFYFKPYDIYFDIEFPDLSKETQDIGINEMQTFGFTKKIKVIANWNFVDGFKDKYQKFRNAFKDLLGHELVHRGEFKRIDKKGIQKVAARSKYLQNKIKSSTIIEQNKIYLAQKLEIMSYAWQTIEELRFNGYINEDILKAVQVSNEKLLKNSSTYMSYFQSFYNSNVKVEDIDDKEVFKNYLKYIYDYIVGNESKKDLDLLVA